MAYVEMWCTKCGHMFINPSEDDCASICYNCRKEDTHLDHEINDRFSDDDIRKLVRNNGYEPEELPDEENTDDYYSDEEDFIQQDDSLEYDCCEDSTDLDPDLMDESDEY